MMPSEEEGIMRVSPVAEVFGYVVCLIAVVVFFASIAGIVNSTFRVINPATPSHVMIGRRIGGHGNVLFWAGHPRGVRERSFGTPNALPPPPDGFPQPMPDAKAMADAGNADRRYDAARRLVL